MTNEELCLLIQQGKNPEKHLEELFLQNRGFIAKMAYQIGGSEEQEDLIQESIFGLVEAVQRWQPGRGASFLSYAAFWIRRVMVRYMKCSALIHIPVNRNDRSVKVQSFEEPIADELRLKDTLQDPQNAIEDEQARMEQEELKAVLWGTVDELEEDEAKVLRMRFQDENTLRECGERMGLSIEAIRRIEARAIHKMRGYRVRRKLAPYVQDIIYSISLQTGLSSFLRTGDSATERAATRLLEERQR